MQSCAGHRQYALPRRRSGAGLHLRRTCHRPGRQRDRLFAGARSAGHGVLDGDAACRMDADGEPGRYDDRQGAGEGFLGRNGPAELLAACRRRFLRDLSDHHSAATARHGPAGCLARADRSRNRSRQLQLADLGRVDQRHDTRDEPGASRRQLQLCQSRQRWRPIAGDRRLGARSDRLDEFECGSRAHGCAEVARHRHSDLDDGPWPGEQVRLQGGSLRDRASARLPAQRPGLVEAEVPGLQELLQRCALVESAVAHDARRHGIAADAIGKRSRIGCFAVRHRVAAAAWAAERRRECVDLRSVAGLFGAR